MSFCTNCGSAMEGRFCTKCGSPAELPEGSGTPATAAPSQPPAAKKKTSPVVWVLAGCLGLIVIGAVILTVGGFFVARKVEQAGGNPAFAAAKLIAQMNPEVEVLESNEDKGTITVREKKTGKVITLDFRDIQKGRMVFTGEGGEKVEIGGEGKSGSVEVKTREGTMRIGGGGEVNAPDWVPEYPGSRPEGAFESQGQEGEAGAYHFKTGDPVEQVAAFYEKALKGAGFEVQKNTMQAGGKSTAILVAKDSGEKREATVAVSQEEGGTQVVVNYKGQ